MKRRNLGLASSVMIFLVLLYDATSQYQLAHFDLNILKSFETRWSDSLNSIILFITDLSGDVAVPVFGISLLIFLCLKRDWRNVAFVFSALIGSLILFTFLKEWVGRARPETKLYDPGHFSFPSGHAAMSTIMALTIYFIFKSKISPSRQTLFLSSCFIFPVLISFTRVFLNVHFPTDVIAGVAISTSWIIVLSYIYHPK